MTDSRRLARLLVASQVALSVILLTNAGLFVRSWQRLLATDLGFTTEGVVMADLMTRPEVDQRPDNETYYPALVDRVRAIAGVERVSLAGGGLTQLVSLMTSEPADGIPAASNAVSPGFFSSLDVRIAAPRPSIAPVHVITNASFKTEFLMPLAWAPIARRIAISFWRCARCTPSAHQHRPLPEAASAHQTNPQELP